MVGLAADNELAGATRDDVPFPVSAGINFGVRLRWAVRLGSAEYTPFSHSSSSLLYFPTTSSALLYSQAKNFNKTVVAGAGLEPAFF